MPQIRSTYPGQGSKRCRHCWRSRSPQERRHDVHLFDPTGELHLQQKRAAHRRELEYAALYCAFLLAILALVMVMGGNQ